MAAASAGAPLAGQLSELFGLAHTALRAIAEAGRHPDPGAGPTGPAGAGPAEAASRLVNSVLRPLAATVATAARQSAQPSPDQAAAQHGDSLWQAAQAATTLRASLGRGCPAGLAEATAALQGLAYDLADGPAATDRCRAEIGANGSYR